MADASEKKPKSKARRGRIDSVSEQIRVAAEAFREISPPEYIRMRPVDLVYFDSVIAEFALAEWSQHQLELACFLARAMSEMEDQQFLLMQEGHLIEIKSRPKKNKAGKTIKPANKYYTENPRKKVVQTCASNILSIRRSLSLHARARDGEGRDIGKRRAKQKEIEKAVTSMDDDDEENLIPRPQTH